MKIFLTEVLKDDKLLVGPYIRANDINEAIKIADMYALTVIGELFELSYELPKKEKVIH
jgi:hypothetical protein